MSNARKQVNIHEAKTQFSRLVDEAALGKTIVIAKAGTPVAKLVPLEAIPAPRPILGLLKGKVALPLDIDTPLPDEMLALFEGR